MKITARLRHARSQHPRILLRRRFALAWLHMVAIFCPFGLFCEINISLPSLQTQRNTAPNLFQRGVEYGKYAAGSKVHCLACRCGYCLEGKKTVDRDSKIILLVLLLLLLLYYIVIL